ncbi:MAG: SDR family oxidoreductase [Egibacteraceae bacterium]
MTPDTNGRAALVLAASKGIGRGCAEELARAGFRVAVCARTTDGVERAVDALKTLGAEAIGVTADVSDPAQLESAFAAVDVAFGRLDVLLANAGGPPPGEFMALDDDAWRTAYELTLMSAVRSIRLAVPRMRANGYGRILVIGSSSVRQPVDNITLSNAFRPALVGLVKSLAGELAGDGITVNMVSPGRIDTERVRDLDERAAQRQGVTYAAARAASVAKIPMGRYGSINEIGALVAFLASEPAGYITGQTPLVDGGLVPTLP